jgi:hypothetical protein
MRYLIGCHRGDVNATDGFPENTLEAMRQAAEKGADIVEMDVHRSADGTFYLCHNDSVDATTNGSGDIDSLTDTALDALVVNGGLGYNAGRHVNLRLPQLDAVLDTLWPFGVLAMIEPKEQTQAAVEELTTLLVAKGWADHCILILSGATQAGWAEAITPGIHSTAASNAQHAWRTPSGVPTQATIRGWFPAHTLTLISGSFASERTDAITAWQRGVRGVYGHEIGAMLAARAELTTAPVTAHSGLTGLANDDHPQYLTSADLPPGGGGDLGPWTAWTPIWTAAGNQPAIGNGTLTGRYKQLDASTCLIYLRLKAGSTTTFGTSTWSFTGLPVTAAFAGVLTGWILDAGTDNKLAVGTIGAGGSVINQVVGEGVNVLHATSPMGWTVNDELVLSGFIET